MGVPVAVPVEDGGAVVVGAKALVEVVDVEVGVVDGAVVVVEGPDVLLLAVVGALADVAPGTHCS